MCVERALCFKPQMGICLMDEVHHRTTMVCRNHAACLHDSRKELSKKTHNGISAGQKPFSEEVDENEVWIIHSVDDALHLALKFYLTNVWIFIVLATKQAVQRFSHSSTVKN
jgi:positive regulator of sigma E activity